ncbi:unnamed protein product [marine sediment metagenome]|uniref:DUF4332 domain-containing protein n=1 Tax=marine sediment metagenome TaxID=412755 RepID=X1A756_9ZZZZ
MPRKEDKLKDKLLVNENTAQRLIEAGFDTLKRIRLADPDALADVPGVSKKDAEEWVAVGWGK